MRTMIVMVVLLFAATTTVAQDAVTLSTTAIANDCHYVDDAEGLREFYVLHLGGEAAGVRFKIEASDGVTMTYVSEEYYQPVLSGDLESGIMFCYAGCQSLGPVVLAKVTYMGYGTSGYCSEIRVRPFPGSNTIEELVCGGGTYYAVSGALKINGGIDCYGCDQWVNYGPPDNQYDFCGPVSTEVLTWGAIKSLYR